MHNIFMLYRASFGGPGRKSLHQEKCWVSLFSSEISNKISSSWHASDVRKVNRKF